MSYQLPSVPTPALGDLFVWGGLVWALLSVLGCGGETNTGVAETDVSTSNTTSDTDTGECTCDGPTSSCPGLVTGNVTDFASQGQTPLEGVRIEGNQSSEVVQTDSGGGYELQVNVCRSPYTIQASLAGYCDNTNTLDISQRQTVNNDIQLEERFVGGIVLDVTPSGIDAEPLMRPLEGIRVSLLDTNISDGSSSLGVFTLERVPVDGELTVIAQDDADDCYETATVDRVRTCERGEAGVQIEMMCRDIANNGCGLCCTGTRALPENVGPGDFCQREEPCAVGEEPVWVCDANLMGATCSCAACPEDNTRGEVCDGRDNDCDGVVDNAGSPTLFDECEDVDGAFVAGCMNGACIYACEGGRVDINGDLAVGSTGNGCECALSNGGVEICDGLDNDCDGLIDDFDTPPSGCEPVEGAFVTLCDAGACTYACEEGRGDADGDLEAGAEGTGCECAVTNEGAELCDNIDNDCDGLVDNFEALTNACAPVDGAIVASCEQGACIYACGDGRGDVNGDLEAGSLGNGCECTVTSGGVEVCDRRDNDCDGLVDNGVMGSSCPFQQGVCLGSVSECIDGLDICANAQYEAAATASGQTFEGIEVLELACDVQDNNCDGEADENCCQMGLDPLSGSLIQPTGISPDTLFQLSPVIVVGRDAVLTAWIEVQLGNASTSVWATAQNILGTGPSPAQFMAQTVGGVPAVAWDGIGFSIVSADEDEILWQRTSAGGASQSQPFALDIDNGAQALVDDIQIVSPTVGEFVLLWREDISVLRARRFDLDGSPIGPAHDLTYPGASPSDPRMALSSSGQGALVLWSDVVAEPDTVSWRTLGAGFVPTDTTGGLEVDTLSNTRMISTSGGYAFVYAAQDGEAIRANYVHLDEDGQIIRSGVIDTNGAEPAPKALAALDGGRTALVWTEDDNVLLYAVLNAQGQMEMERRVLFEGNAGAVSMKPLYEPGRTSRPIGFALAVTSGNRLYLGRINLEGDFMCFNP